MRRSCGRDTGSRGIGGPASGGAAFARPDRLAVRGVNVMMPLIDPVPPGLIAQPLRRDLTPNSYGDQ